MQNEQLEQVRRFNRIVTLRAGALDNSYLGQGRPLGLARLLFEVGLEGRELRSLREELGLDSGYMSRLLKRLEQQGLIAVQDDPADRRRRLVLLTDKGKAEREAYDRLSDDLARNLLAPLGTRQRERLLAAMAEVERVMMAASITIAPVSHNDPEALACVAAYFAELDARFEEGFDPGRGAAAPQESPEPDPGIFFLARAGGKAVGCATLRALDTDVAEIKRMWVAPDARGIGLSRQLLTTLETQARGLGHTRVRLDTNRSLGEARALYASAGYRPIERYNDNPYADFWFEKRLSENGVQAG